MIAFSYDKDPERANRALTGINKICILVDKEEKKPSYGITESYEHKYLCPCGIVSVEDQKRTQPEVERLITIRSEKCGI